MSSPRDDLDHVLAIRVNDPPTVFRGCTAGELIFIAVLSLAMLLPLCTFVASFVGGWMLGLGAAFLLMLGSVFVSATILQRIKRNRPPGYYQQLIPIALHRRGIVKSRFRLPKGKLALGRTR
ncbi:TIGR03750 family conjugal transfer protein [Hyphococcus luteus]|nr:TIGR03750 family conjugal transfer protein [Marinicaulis flavus]